MSPVAAIRPSRPMMRYHGGKWLLAPWIISHMPEHRVYVEPYGGADSVLLRKPRSYAEVYNDLDGEVVNVFRVARDMGSELLRALELTPFSRDDYILAWQPCEEPVERARRTIFRSFAGFASSAATAGRAASARGGKPQTGFRSNSKRTGTTPAQDWRNYPSLFEATIERLRGVVIENTDAIDLMLAHDSPRTLHYVDPPYVQSTRDSGKDYVHEMSDDEHVALAGVLNSLRGMVMLSAYQCELYDQLYRGWNNVQKKSMAGGAMERTEVLWMRNFAHANLLI